MSGRRKQGSPILFTCVLISTFLSVSVASAQPPADTEEQLWRHRNLGKAFYENSATQLQAVEEFEKALKLAPDSTRERINHGLALLRAGKEEQGIAELETAQAQDPSIPHTWFNLGIAYKRAGRFDDARRQLEGMRERVPTEAVTRYNLGVVYKLADEPERAIAEFRQASELDPNLAGPYFQLATSLRQAGETDEAKQAMEQFRVLKRRDAQAAVPEDLEWSWYSEIYDVAEPVPPVWDAPPADDGARQVARSLVEGPARAKIRHAAWGDVDDDGGLDLVVVGEKGARLWRRASPESGDAGATEFERTDISWPGDFRVAVFADIDHDYDLDLLLLGADQRLLRNQGPKGWLDRSDDFPFRDGTVRSAVRLDVMADSQGVDLAMVYDDGLGVLYRDRLGGRYQRQDLSLLPEGVLRLDAADLNRDGWTDLVVSTEAGRTALTNAADPAGEGGFDRVVSLDAVGAWSRDEVGPTIEVALRGVKNLKAAQGSEVEVKAGAFYQKKLYDGRPIVFDLPTGTDIVDTVRITWPNGLIQNESRQKPARYVYEEAQRLSGSCPMIFTWNGEEFEFITDVLGVAPLGAAAGDGPDGRQYFPVDHDEVIQIRGDQLVPRLDDEGRSVYELRITEELREVAFLDQVRLVAVDHADDVDVFVNSKFKGPPFPEHKLFAVHRDDRIPPRRALDPGGRNVTDPILSLDRSYPVGFDRSYDGTAEMHWLELEFEPAAAGDEPILVLSGWVDWADGSTFLGTSQAGQDLVMPYLQVRNSAGDWETVLDDMGLPAGKPKTIVVDLSGKFPTADHTAEHTDSLAVRILTNLALYWDEIFLAPAAAGHPLTRTELDTASAEIRFRGFARPVIHPQRLQPERFVYADVRPWTMWNPTPGHYTRFGDVEPLLRQVDDRLVIMGSGDEIVLQFDALEEPGPGLRRDFLLIVDGWAKDGDANTAHSQTVGPLPFHAMPQYPYDGLADYPDDPELRLWREHYNTRPALRLIRPLAPSSPNFKPSSERSIAP